MPVGVGAPTHQALGLQAGEGGRQMNAQLLRDSFQNLLGPAKAMQEQYLPQIRQKAGNLDMGQIMNMVRGG